MMDDLLASFYETLHRGSPGDVEFYRRLCHGKTRVLELGCGFGRVLEHLGSEQTKVTGLDSDAALLQRARKRVPDAKFIHRDMVGFEIGEFFDAIVLPYNALYCLEDENALIALFQSVNRHLDEGGVFAFDVWNPAEVMNCFDTEDEEEHFVATFFLDRKGWHAFCQDQWDIPGRRLWRRYRFTALDRSDETYSQEIVHRWFSQAFLNWLLTQHGFEPHWYGSFSCDALAPESEHCIAVCTKRRDRK